MTALVPLALALVNLALAAALAAALIVAIGADPVVAFDLLWFGAFGYGEAVGYTLTYATSFVFAGLAVAIARHAGLFNIGGEGQAILGGLGVGLVALALDDWPWPVVAAAAVATGAAFGAAWAWLPGWLQARRGAHVVITTIMANQIAAALMTWLMVDVLIAPHGQAPESRVFAAGSWLPSVAEVLAPLGLEVAPSPLNLSAVLALAMAAAAWALIYRTPRGFELRAVGANAEAARRAGIDPGGVVVRAMVLSGACAGLVGVNEILGVHHRLLLGFTGGVGFVGVAVAMIGRNHPLGVVLAALLFGALVQGGSELAFEYRALDRDFVIILQGLVIFLAGGLEGLVRPWLARRARRRATA